MFRKISSLAPLNSTCIEASDVTENDFVSRCAFYCSKQANCLMFSLKLADLSSCKIFHSALLNNVTNSSDSHIFESLNETTAEFSTLLAQGG